jgi:hypothetical protein
MVTLRACPSNQSNGLVRKGLTRHDKGFFLGFAVSRLTLPGTAGGVALSIQAKFHPLPGFGNEFIFISNISHPKDLSSY